MNPDCISIGLRRRFLLYLSLQVCYNNLACFFRDILRLEWWVFNDTANHSYYKVIGEKIESQEYIILLVIEMMIQMNNCLL